MLGVGVELLRQLSDRLSAIGQEGHLLVGLHALGLQQAAEGETWSLVQMLEMWLRTVLTLSTSRSAIS